MVRSLKISLIGFILLMPSLAYAFELQRAETAFKKLYPKVEYQGFDSGPVNGFYEIVAGDNIFYYHPSTGYLFFGEIFTKEGKSLTGQRRNELLLSKKPKDSDNDPAFANAIKIGTGSTTVVEFSDPDCSYCRQAAASFFGVTDITRYVYFLPLPTHPDAELKAKYILCAKDKAKAYYEIYGGRYDNGGLPPLPSGCNAEELLKKHINKAISHNIDTTPTFFINQTRIDGFDAAQIKTLLGNGNN